MPEMTQAQIEEFLKAPRHAVVGTRAANGSPQLSPVWYVYEGGRMYVSVGPESAKYRNLKRDRRISVCVDGGFRDFRAVIIYGTAEIIEPGGPRQEEWRRRIIRQYHDSDEEARRYAESTQAEPAAILVITPQRILSQDFN
jgi:PPOX class probable F420-dependent enzyme